MDPKAALRAEVRAARRARPEHERHALARSLRDVVLAAPAVAAATRVACYVSLATEPGTAPLRQALRQRGCHVLLPVVVRGEENLDWALDGSDADLDPQQAPPSRLNDIAAPRAPRLGAAALATCDVVLVPALAADLHGARLGQGAGYYDRALAAVPPRAPVVAVVHDDEVLEPGRIPVLPHDVRVTALVTPARWVPVIGRANRP